MTRYWNADSDRDWEDSVSMYEEPMPEAGEPVEERREVLRKRMLDQFFDACEEIADIGVRVRVRSAGVEYANTCVRVSLERMLRAIQK